MDPDAPIIFKRNKPKPARRARQVSPEQERDGGNSSTGDATPSGDAQDESPATLATKLKNKMKRPKTKSKLSFGGPDEEEGDGEVFKLKKSSLSQKMALGIHPASGSVPLDQPTASNYQGPKYDSAYLSELKAGTPSARPRAVDELSVDVEMSVEYQDEVVMEDSPMAIPSESSVKVAREKRERLRKVQETGEQDFISLSVTRREDVHQGPHPESRLVREEDELGEGDDEFAEYTSAQERIALGKKAVKAEAAQRRTTMQDLIDDAEEEDEETTEWVQAQLRRAGNIGSGRSQTPKVKPVYKAAPIPEATPIPTLNPAMSRLAQELSRLTTSHAQNSASLNSLAKEQHDLDDRENEMRELVEKAEAKRAWFGTFNEWVESVAGFLDEKYPLLEALEADHVTLLKERKGIIEARRKADDSDDLSTFTGIMPPPNIDDLTTDEVDDLGRTVPKPDPVTQKLQRRAARAGRRATRRSRQQKVDVEEGYSTDGSLPPDDQSSYSDALKDLSSRRKGVLADVRAEEFKDPGRGQWNVWREKYSDSYVGAWGGLGLVSVWEFWVRLECVGWDCIEDRRTLDHFKWYKGLYEYCRPANGKPMEERELGVDGDLVASMVSTAVIPMVVKRVDSGALDVYSAKHVRRMVDLAEEIEASMEPDSPKFQLLLQSVKNAFNVAVEGSESLIANFDNAGRSVPGFNPEAIPARRRFIARRVKLLQNLVVWRKYTGERFGLDAVIGRLAERCILSVAEGGWDVGGKEMVGKIVKILPENLIPTRLRQLQQTGRV